MLILLAHVPGYIPPSQTAQGKHSFRTYLPSQLSRLKHKLNLFTPLWLVAPVAPVHLVACIPVQLDTSTAVMGIQP